MITKQELIEELKVKEPRIIRRDLQEKLFKKWEIDGKPLECGCGKEIPSRSEHYKQIENNLFIVACGKKENLKYRSVTMLRRFSGNWRRGLSGMERPKS